MIIRVCLQLVGNYRTHKRPRILGKVCGPGRRNTNKEYKRQDRSVVQHTYRIQERYGHRIIIGCRDSTSSPRRQIGRSSRQRSNLKLPCPSATSGDDAPRLLISRALPDYVRIALPWQPECPQAHITSVCPLRPSQCVLQNFESLAAAQLQAGFAHFFASDMNISFADSPHLRPKAARSEMPGCEHAQVGVDPFF